jgi:predicted Ser/Thr protein kinase
MENILLRLRDKVHDEQSFLKFIQALIADRTDEVKREKIKSSLPYSAGANGWENITIEDYLESASAWAVDSNFGRTLHAGKFNNNSWSQFANFLYAGKIYE